MPLPIFVNTKRKNRVPKMMADGIIILTDFDSIKNTTIPKAKQKIAVRVPDWNMPQMIARLVSKKNILSFLKREVMPITKKVTAVAAALHP